MRPFCFVGQFSQTSNFALLNKMDPGEDYDRGVLAIVIRLVKSNWEFNIELYR